MTLIHNIRVAWNSKVIIEAISFNQSTKRYFICGVADLRLSLKWEWQWTFLWLLYQQRHYVNLGSVSWCRQNRGFFLWDWSFCSISSNCILNRKCALIVFLCTNLQLKNPLPVIFQKTKGVSCYTSLKKYFSRSENDSNFDRNSEGVELRLSLSASKNCTSVFWPTSPTLLDISVRFVP